MIPYPFQEFDAAKKDELWMARLIDALLPGKEFLITYERYHEYRRYAEGTFDTQKYKEQYDLVNKTEKDLVTDFQPLDVMGHIIESILNRIDSEEINITAQCTDALAISKEERDIQLLKVRKKLQPDLDKISRALNLKTPLQFPDKVEKNGQRVDTFSSDVSAIDKMKLNPDDEGDMEIFQDVYQRQHKEIAIEDSVEHYFKVSDVKELRKKSAIDDIIGGRMSIQNRMNNFSSQPDISYIPPYEAFVVGGKRKDRKDADGMGWEGARTIRQLLQYMGKTLDVENLDKILALANTASNCAYNCIDGYERYFNKNKEWGEDGALKQSCSWSTFIEMRISLGYIEIKSQNADAYELLEKYGQEYEQKINTSAYSEHDLKKKKIEHRYYDVTYKCYYIPGLFNRCYAFGKVPMQMRFGNQNELTDFTIQVYVERGQSLIKRCMPLIKHLCSLWYKYQYFVSKAMPSGEMWDMDAVRKVAQKVLEADGDNSSPEDIVRLYETQTSILYKSKNEDGSPVGGDGVPMKKRERGVDPSVKEIVLLMNNTMNMIRDIMGSNALAEGQEPQANEPEKLAEIAVKGAFASTNFITSGIRKLLSNTATVTGWYVQQIVDSDDQEAIDAVTKAIGEDNVKVLRTLQGESPAKYSIFLEDTMTSTQKLELNQLIDGLISKGQLPAGIGLQIKGIKNYKTASAVLGFQERRALSMAMQKQQQQIQLELQQKSAESQLKINEINAKSAGDLQKEKEITARAIQVEQIKAGSKDALSTKAGVRKIVQDTHAASLQTDHTMLESKLENNSSDQAKDNMQQDNSQQNPAAAPPATPQQQQPPAAA